MHLILTKTLYLWWWWWCLYQHYSSDTNTHKFNLHPTLLISRVTAQATFQREDPGSERCARIWCGRWRRATGNARLWAPFVFFAWRTTGTCPRSSLQQQLPILGAAERPVSTGYGTPTRLRKNTPQEDGDSREAPEGFAACTPRITSSRVTLLHTTAPHFSSEQPIRIGPHGCELIKCTFFLH